MRRWCGRVVAVVAAAGVLAGCGSHAPKGTSQTSNNGSPASRSAASESAAGGTFGGTDLAWLEISIAIDEELLPMLDLVPAHDAGPGVTALADRTRTITATELPVLRSLHDEAKLPSQNPHEGMTMPGMMSADEIAKAETLSGAAFDTYLRTKIDEALNQAVNLAQSEQQFGQEPRTRALAAKGAAERKALLPRSATTASPQPS